jgi:hypothetical protein
MEKNGKSKIIYYLIGIVIALVSLIYTIQVNKTDAVGSQLNNHEKAQYLRQEADTAHWSSIDNRLGNLESNMSALMKAIGLKYQETKAATQNNNK